MDDKLCKNLIHKGVALYADRKYEESLSVFQYVYAYSKVPEVMINIARSLDHLDRPQEALELYKQYLTQRPGSELASSVQHFIAQAQAHQAAMLSRSAHPAEKDGRSKLPAGASGIAARPGQSSAPTEQKTPSQKRTWVITGGLSSAFGIAGLFAGAGFYGAMRTARDMVINTTTDEFIKRSMLQKSQSLDDPMIASYIVGSIMLSVGTSLIIYGRYRKKKEEALRRSTAVTLIASDRFIGAMLGGTY